MEIRIPIPEGYEIDEKNSTFECIKFIPLEENPTYEYICKRIFKEKVFYTKWNSNIECRYSKNDEMTNKNNSLSEKQLEKLLALNQLLNIAEYYNKQHPTCVSIPYTITYTIGKDYEVAYYNRIGTISYGFTVRFNKREDAQKVINNPNFRKILDVVYK